MKSRYLLFLALLVMFLHSGTEHLFAQIPNPGFENWTDGNPDDWGTSNDPGFVENITQTASSHTGSFAVEGVVVENFGFPLMPVMYAGTDGEGFPVSEQHAALHGWYKLTPLNSDGLYITVGMLGADSVIGGGGLILTGTQSTYREFGVNLVYTSGEVPDTCIIAISLAGTGGGFPTIGSTFVLDDLSFGVATSITQNGNIIPGSFGLSQNYPNPFNPTTFITFSIPKADNVHLAVFDPLGREVAVLVDGIHEAGNYRVEFDGTNLPSGMYFYRLQAGEFSQVNKLMLVK